MFLVALLTRVRVIEALTVSKIVRLTLGPKIIIVACMWGLFYVLCFSWQQGLGMVLPCIVIVPVLSYQIGLFPEPYFPICYSWLKSLHPIRWSFAIFLPKTSVWAWFFKFRPNLCTCMIVYIGGLLCGRPVTDGNFYLCPSRFLLN